MAMSEDARQAELAFGGGAVTGSLIGSGLIAEGGVLASSLSSAATAVGLNGIADMGIGAATAAAGILGPAGLIVAGVVGGLLVYHSFAGE